MAQSATQLVGVKGVKSSVSTSRVLVTGRLGDCVVEPESLSRAGRGSASAFPGRFSCPCLPVCLFASTFVIFLAGRGENGKCCESEHKLSDAEDQRSPHM